VKKDHSQIQNHKNKTIREIKQELPVFEKQELNMPQFSEKYLKEREEENRPKVMEGYLTSLLNLSENLPFHSVKAEMNFTLEPNEYVKVLREVERIKLGEEVEPELLKIDPTFDVQVGEVLMTFTMEE
tara:strand:- start:2321 stop:2704 length:384 start_codon:yes stop_codon:yes gene_type:complete